MNTINDIIYDDPKLRMLMHHHHHQQLEQYEHHMEEGEGLFSSIRNIGNKIVNTTKSIAHKVDNTTKSIVHKVEDYGNAVINGRNDFPPKVRDILSKYGDKTIRSIVVGRSPVPSVLTSALSFVSGGQFGSNLSHSSYDKLFHLFLRIQLDDNTVVSLFRKE
jgi:hypothetical protein